MNTLKNIAALLLFLGTTGVASAQEDRHPRHHDHKQAHHEGPKEELTAEQRAEEKTKRMTEELNLTEAQIAEVKVINLAHFERMDEIKAERKVFMKELAEKKKGHKEEMKDKVRAERTKTKSSMDDVLTDEQREKLKERKDKKCPCCDHNH